MKLERLDKQLAGTGRWSRKEVKALVKAGRVQIDGVTASDPGQKLSPTARVLVDGQEIFCNAFTYLMLNKPAGVVSATEDEVEKTVIDLLPKHLQKIGLFPVGRLDKDTEGLLILTNDGPLAHALLSPRRHVEKVYFARVDGQLNEEDIKAFAQGVALRDETVCLPAVLEPQEAGNACLVKVCEGKYHQVKRMLASRGKPVKFLKRLSMGGLSLDEALPLGGFRPLSPEETRLLAHNGDEKR